MHGYVVPCHTQAVHSGVQCFAYPCASDGAVFEVALIDESIRECDAPLPMHVASDPVALKCLSAFEYPSPMPCEWPLAHILYLKPLQGHLGCCDWSTFPWFIAAQLSREYFETYMFRYASLCWTELHQPVAERCNMFMDVANVFALCW